MSLGTTFYFSDVCLSKCFDRGYWLRSFPIQASILVGHVVDLKPTSLLKLSVSYILGDYLLLCFRPSCLEPHPSHYRDHTIGNRGGLFWWEAAFRRTVKFMRGWR